MTKQELVRWVDLRDDGTGDGLPEVVARELALLRPEVRAHGAAVTALLHEEFREFGSSGRMWDRGDRASRSDRVTLRSSLWIRSGEGWQLLFHQGTVCP